MGRKWQKKSHRKIAVISIGDIFHPSVGLQSGGSIVDVFHLNFLDLNPNKDYAQKIPELHDLVDKYKAKPEDFEGLSEFIDKIISQCDVLIISSPEGYSRAAGLAAAIEEYIGFPDLVWCNRRLKPNEYIYQLAWDYLCGKYI